jgi:DNA repair exonuclease SbcCD ATPase subunit
MPATAEQVREQLADEIKGLAASVKELDRGQASIQTDLKWIKGIGWFIAALLIAGIGGGGTVIWRASDLSSEVKHQGERLDKLETKVDRLETKVDQGFGQIMQRLDQVVAKPKP